MDVAYSDAIVCNILTSINICIAHLHVVCVFIHLQIAQVSFDVFFFLCLFFPNLIHIYRRVLYKSVSTDLNYWNVARTCIAAVWDAHARIYHGYEVLGIENIPTEGGALIVYYHGAIPIDMYYLVARIYLERNKLIHTVGDRFLFKLPGWGIISDAMKVFPGTVQICSQILKEGNLLAISPGGVFEAQFGNNLYELLWKKRFGFAKVAIEAKAVCTHYYTFIMFNYFLFFPLLFFSQSYQCLPKI